MDTRSYITVAKDEDGRPVSAHAVLFIDPATLSTAQQKKFSWRQRRVFPNSKVTAGKRIVCALASPLADKICSVIPNGSCVAMTMTFLFAYPKSTPKSRAVDDVPQPSHGDADNRGKAPVDALTDAGWWPDDRFVTTMTFRKRLTTRQPRIEIEVKRDEG